jgi:hypothetical protein
MPTYHITPLAPAYVLLLGAVIILSVGSALPWRRRHQMAIGASVLAALSLFLAGSGDAAGAHLVRVLVDWWGQPALILRVPSFEPFLWVLIVSLLALFLTLLGSLDCPTGPAQATLLVFTAAACAVVLAGSYASLALAIFLFDAIAALFAVSVERPGWAVGRLLLGVLSSAAVVATAQGADTLATYPFHLGALFSLTVWLRLGLYPLLESDVPASAAPVIVLGWNVVNMTVGLYLMSAGLASEVVWLAGLAALLHGALAWLEPVRERMLLHAGYALAGGLLTMTLVVGYGSAALAGSIGLVAALVALSLVPSRLGYPDRGHTRCWGAYLAPLLATASLLGVPLTLGWEGRGALYRATWQVGLPGTLAVAVLAEGAALAVLYRYWQTLLRSEPLDVEPDSLALEKVPEAGSLSAPGTAPIEGHPDSRLWPVLAATLASLPFLVPIWGFRLLMTVGPAPSPDPNMGLSPWSAPLGLIGSLLWAFFLGYGRSRLLEAMPVSSDALMSALRLNWLLHGLGCVVDSLGRVLLRMRVVIEGEHYLAWAILLALGLGLFILLR